MLALLLSKGLRRFFNFHRVIIYLPAIIPMIVVGIVFRSILHPATGALNEFLRAIGLDFLTQQWLTNPDIAALLRNRCGYLEGHWIYYGDYDRRPSGDSHRVL